MLAPSQHHHRHRLHGCRSGPPDRAPRPPVGRSCQKVFRLPAPPCSRRRRHLDASLASRRPRPGSIGASRLGGSLTRRPAVHQFGQHLGNEIGGHADDGDENDQIDPDIMPAAAYDVHGTGNLCEQKQAPKAGMSLPPRNCPGCICSCIVLQQRNVAGGAPALYRFPAAAHIRSHGHSQNRPYGTSGAAPPGRSRGRSDRPRDPSPDRRYGGNPGRYRWGRDWPRPRSMCRSGW